MSCVGSTNDILVNRRMPNTLEDFTTDQRCDNMRYRLSLHFVETFLLLALTWQFYLFLVYQLECLSGHSNLNVGKRGACCEYH